MFCGTEFGVFFSTNGGGHWKQIKAGLPTIAVRDIAIQERENDLVLGTFGRGFYVLDDYSSLRQVGDAKMGDLAQIFPIRDALVYEESSPLGLTGKSFQGDAFYSAENLGPVVLIDYFMPESFKGARDQRRKDAAKAAKDGKDNPYPTYDELVEEAEEVKDQLIFTITNNQGEIVRKIYTSPKKGINRLKWDMRTSSTSPINLNKPSFYNPFAGVDAGPLVPPGDYKVSLSKVSGGETEVLVEGEPFTLVPLEDRIMPTTDLAGKKAFQDDIAELSRQISGSGRMISEVGDKLRHIKAAIEKTNVDSKKLHTAYQKVNKEMREIRTALYGDNIKTRLDIDQPPTPAGRIGWIEYEQGSSTAPPTGTHKMSYQIAKDEFEPILTRLRNLVNTDLESLEQMLEDADAPYTPGRAIKMIE